MELTIMERLVLSDIMERVTSTRLKYKSIQIYREALQFDEEEIEKYDLVDVPGEGVKCPDWTILTDIPTGDIATEAVIKALKDLDQKGLVYEPHMSLFDKFGVEED